MDSHYDISNSLGFLTITAHRLLSVYFRKRVGDTGIDVTVEQWGVLVHLWNKGGIAQDELAYRLCVDKSSLSRVLDGMERRGLVLRKRDPDDARRKILFATALAEELRKPCLEEADKALEEILKNIQQDELTICLKVLTQVKHNIRNTLE